MVNLVDKGVATEWSTKKGALKNVRWSAQLGDRGYLPPVVAGGKVFIGTNNRNPRDPSVKGAKAILLCFRESDGQFLWQIAHDMPPPEVVTQAKEDGLLSTPTVEGDRLYYVAPAAEVVCAGTDGKIVWSVDLMKQLKVHPCYVTFCCPLGVGDLVFVVTGNGRVGGDTENAFPEPRAPSFVALEKKTGKIAWTDNSPGEKVMEGQWTSPVYAEVNGKPQVIFPGGDGVLYAFEPATGKLIWKFDANPPQAEFKLGGRGTRNYLMAPAVHENRLYTGIGQNPDNGSGLSYLWCVDITRTGDLSPQWTVTDANAKPVKTAPKPNTGGVVWFYGGDSTAADSVRDYILGRSISTPAIHGGLVYFAEQDGFLHCLDAKTGKHYWEEDLKANVWAAPLWVDGKVYLGDDVGIIHIFAHGKEKKKLQSVEMEDGTKAGVVAANGVLYVTTEKHLYAIQAK
jgi:outer membrane protein assembly factor BamB